MSVIFVAISIIVLLALGYWWGYKNALNIISENAYDSLCISYKKKLYKVTQINDKRSLSFMKNFMKD